MIIYAIYEDRSYFITKLVKDDGWYEEQDVETGDAPSNCESFAHHLDGYFDQQGCLPHPLKVLYLIIGGHVFRRDMFPTDQAMKDTILRECADECRHYGVKVR